MIKKIIYQKIFTEIKKANNILLTLHPAPDGDSIGSNLALFHILTKMGKKVTLISGDSPVPKYLSSLPNVNKILIKNIFEIDLKNYDLFIITDISDKKQISKQGEVDLPKNLKTITIDHHASNTKFANINLVDAISPATCQILYQFLKSQKIKITKEAAGCLFVGIYTDSGGFKYVNTTAETFSIASDLTKIYPEFYKLIFEIENNDSPDRLKFLSLMLNSITHYFSDKVAIASIDFKTVQENNIDNSVVNGSEIANILKSVIGWEIGVSLIEVQPNLVKMSFRTRDGKKYDLTKISVALGGGGHKAAAGVTMNKSLTQAKEILLATLKKVYPKLDTI